MEANTLNTQFNNPKLTSLYNNYMAQRDIASQKEQNDSHYYKMKNPDLNKPKGKLVQGSILPNPLKEVPKDLNSFKDALSGKGTDYNVGRLNDLAIAGSAGLIALVLSGVQKSAKLKAMEFVGAGAWLASMHLWPKLFLAKPLKAATGVDLNLNYINAQGEQKPFWMDPQYQPADLLTQEMLDEAGDKLNVPKDLKDRDEETLRRMKQVAVSTNTWWMLTAGFSTPIMASLIANRAEGPIGYAINKTQSAVADARLEAAGLSTDTKNPLVKFGKNVINWVNNLFAKYREKRQVKALEKVLENGDKEAVEKFFKKHFGKQEELYTTICAHINGSYNDGKLLDKEYLVNIFKEAKKVQRMDNALRIKKQAIMSEAGRQREKLVKKYLRTMFSRNEIKELAESKDITKISEKISERAIQLAKDGKAKDVAEAQEKLRKAHIEYMKKSLESLESIGKQLLEQSENSPFKNSIKRTTIRFNQEISDKLANTEATFSRAPRILNLATEEDKAAIKTLEEGFRELFDIKETRKLQDTLATAARTLTSHDVNNNLAHTPTDSISYPVLNNTREFLEALYGKGKSNIKKIMEFIKISNRPDKERYSSRLSDFLGETPAELFQKAAKEYNNSINKWFKNIAVMGGGLLLATTGIALFTISQSAKNKKIKEENREVGRA